MDIGDIVQAFKLHQNLGQSQLVSLVLGVGLTAGVAAVVTTQTTEAVGTMTAEASNSSDHIVVCGQSRMHIEHASWKNGDIVLVVKNEGNTLLSNVTVAVTAPDGRIDTFYLRNESLGGGEIVQSTLGVAGPVESIRVASKECPSISRSTVSRIKPCPEGMAHIDLNEVNEDTVNTSSMDDFCIFKYEASRLDANSTYEGSSTIAASQQGVVPWTDIPQDHSNQVDARDACQNAGYQLVSNKQWQAATKAIAGDQDTFVRGNNNRGKSEKNPSETCSDDPTDTAMEQCLTGTGPDSWCTEDGVCDLNGNVLEWTSSFFGNNSACDSDTFDDDGDTDDGYITAWNSNKACPAEIDTETDKTFDSDYYWSQGNQYNDWGAVRRGGHYGNGKQSGPWEMSLNSQASYYVSYTGFRCSLD